MPLKDPHRVALVAAGGAVGALARWQLGADATLLVNVAGAGLLGYLVGRVPVRTPRDEAIRLALGTGVLGGFTTFSTYAVQVARRFPHHTAGAVTYAAVSVVAGVLAAVVGLALGAAQAPQAPQAPRAPEAPE